MKTDKVIRKSLKKYEQMETKEDIDNLELHNVLTSNETRRLVKERLQAYVEWTEEAEVGLNKSATEEEKKSLSLVVIQKIRSSIAGQFIEEFNPRQDVTPTELEKKLFVAKYTLDQEEFPASYSQSNNFVDELITHLKFLIQQTQTGKVSLMRFLKSLNHIRLPFSKVGFIDKPMNYLSNLQVLNLAGNNISYIPFEWLPKKLHFLELSGNMMSEFNYSSNGPHLIYLGLSYNLFNDRSNLAELTLMKYLVHLDLSENDLNDLSNLLECLILIPKLVSLNLKGNPCSLITGYALLVSRGLPNLLRLDGESLGTVRLDDKREDGPRKMDDILYGGKLKIHIFRIMGIPKPKLPKNVQGHFEIEVKFPLLDKKLKEKLKFQIEEEIENEIISNFDTECNSKRETNTNIDKNATSDKDLMKNKVLNNGPGVSTEKEHLQKSKTSLLSKSLWKIGFELYLSRDVGAEDVEGLTSDKIAWNTVMRPKNPVFEVYVPFEEITDLRDTLRTIITLRIFFCEEFKNKKEKPGGKARTLVAKIAIPAEIPLWSEDYRGFVWSAKKYCIAKPYPNIADIKFSTGGKGMVKIGDMKSAVFPPPSYPCCHIGLSL